jgi:hypothetical protein
MNSNLARLKDIALVLGEIKDQVVFVGGATVSLYIDDQPTKEARLNRVFAIIDRLIS